MTKSPYFKGLCTIRSKKKKKKKIVSASHSRHILKSTRSYRYRSVPYILMCIVDFEISLSPRIRHMEKASHRDDLFRRTSIREPREQHDDLFRGIDVLWPFC